MYSSILLLLFASTPIPLQEDARPKSETPQISIEEEVLANVKSQPIGPATVDDLNLPGPFLRRVASRAIRSSFEERYRIVVPDPKPEDSKPVAVEPPKVTTPAMPVAPREGMPMGLIVGTIAFAGFLALVMLTRKKKDVPR